MVRAVSPFFKSLSKNPNPSQFRLQPHRNFVNAKVKWVRDPWLDNVVSKEKNLKPILALKTLILSSPTKTLPITTVSAHKHHHFHLPTTTTTSTFIQKYPSVFRQFLPCSFSLPHVRLTQQALDRNCEELVIYNSPDQKKDAVERLIKLLMLTGVKKLPLRVVDLFRFDLGLPPNYILTLLANYPEYFHVSSVKVSNSEEVLCLELLKWRNDLSVSVIEKRAVRDENCGYRISKRLKFPMQLPNGFDLKKKVVDWVEEWQNLPYISPYENGFHLNPNSDKAEKWTVAVLHELLHLLVSKKTEIVNVSGLFESLGFDKLRLKHAVKHHPGIFYLSNKIRTQTLVLREGYRKEFLVEKHPLMGMRYRYIHLMNKSKKRCKKVAVLAPVLKKPIPLRKSGERGDTSREEEDLDGSSGSELEDSGVDEEIGMTSEMRKQ